MPGSFGFPSFSFMLVAHAVSYLSMMRANFPYFTENLKSPAGEGLWKNWPEQSRWFFAEKCFTSVFGLFLKRILCGRGRGHRASTDPLHMSLRPRRRLTAASVVVERERCGIVRPRTPCGRRRRCAGRAPAEFDWAEPGAGRCPAPRDRRTCPPRWCPGRPPGRSCRRPPW